MANDNTNMWNILEDNDQSSSTTGLGSMDAVYRPAFPAYKVFIYGHEISPDVMSIRVNQSGGSLERMPSTVSLTIANRYEKFTLTHEDMIYIGAYKNAVKQGVSPENINVSYDPKAFGYEYSNPIVGRPKFDKSGQLLSTMMGRSAAHPIGQYNISPATMNELVTRLKSSSVEEARYTIEAFFSNIGGQYGHKDTESTFRGLTSDQLDSIASQLKEEADSGSFDGFEEWNEEELPFLVKREVVEKKLDKKNRSQASSQSTGGARALKDIEGTIYRYPMQEGDFIFSLNDPVRIAYRDPFNPKMWYWMFTGFLDTWTETVGPDLDSTITVTCTDVTKMARYSLTTLRPGLVDVNLKAALGQVNSSGSEEIKTSDLVMTKQVFEGLTVLQIMELLFFGSVSTKDLINSSKALYLEALSLFDTNEELSMDDLYSFMIVTLGIPPDQLKSLIHNSTGDNLSYSEVKLGLKDYLTNSFGAKQIARVETLDWPQISHPGDIRFKRKDDVHGVDFRIYGKPPGSTGETSRREYEQDADAAFGATTLKDFYTWNEEIHHRVKKSDLWTLSVDNVSEDNPANFSIEQVIHIIGTDLDTYPVGHGKVYYCAPAGMTSLLGSGVVDKAFGGTESFHSVFKDRLTMLYDIAETLEWRFYATPKGDVVMEHPFYDFDPQEFFKSKSFSTNYNASQSFFEDYDTIFGQAYSGGYDNVEALTQMVFELNTNNEALLEFMKDPVFSYEKMFTVGIDEQLSFSNTNTDKGLITTSRVKQRRFNLLDGSEIDATRQFVYVTDTALIPLLGFRLQEGNIREYITGEEGASLYCALKLNQNNAEARNVGLETVPKFGLMVNRPLLWRYRNYYCNIISCAHSITWNSDVTTSINVNQIRAWAGAIEEGSPKYSHFGDSDRPFNWAELVYNSRKSNTLNRKQDPAKEDAALTTLTDSPDLLGGI